MGLFSTKEKLVSICIGKNTLSLHCIEKTKNNKFSLYATQQKSFDLPIIENLSITNLTLLKNIVINFLKDHQLKDSFALLSLGCPGIVERVISLSVEAPQEHHLQQDANPKPLAWDYMPLSYQRQTEKTLYYLCGIEREHIFHFQLLAILAGLNCIALVPQRIALLSACTYLFPDQSHRSSITNHATLQSYITYSIDTADLDTLFEQPIPDKKQLFESLGLYLLGNQNL